MIRFDCKHMKQKNKKVSDWKLDSLSILLFILLIFFACKEEKLVAQDLNNSSAERDLFTIVEEAPSYEGGMDAFYSHLMKDVRYPSKARINGIEGQVKVQFNIERNGSISDVRTIKDIGDGCGIEAERIVKGVTSFKPGSQRGRTVKTSMVLPVNFKLEPEKVNADNSPQGSIIFGELEMRKERLQIDVEYKDGAWHGILKDNYDKPLPGANIVVQGTNYGRVSDLDGTFSVIAKESQNVIVSYVGYESIMLKQMK